MTQKARVIALRENSQHIRSCGNSQFQRYRKWYITQADLRVKHNSILFLHLLLCKRNILVFSLIKGQLEHSSVGTILKENRLRFHSQPVLRDKVILTGGRLLINTSGYWDRLIEKLTNRYWPSSELFATAAEFLPHFLYSSRIYTSCLIHQHLGCTMQLVVAQIA